MIELLFWFLVSQTISGLPDMVEDTEVRVVSMDLLTIFASAEVQDSWLILEGKLEPDSAVRVMILRPGDALSNSPKGDDAESNYATSDYAKSDEAMSNKALRARISADGEDILLYFEEIEGPLSFRRWLIEERGINLRLVFVEGGNKDD